MAGKNRIRTKICLISMQTSDFKRRDRPPRRSRTRGTRDMKTQLKALFAAAALAFAAPVAKADEVTEQFVRDNASVVLQSLNDPDLDSAGRRAAFSRYMDQFTDIEAVSNFVIGKYARRLSAEDLARYREAFRTYALATYEFQLDSYRGESVEIVGSDDRSATDSIVRTLIRRDGGDPVDVRWRVLTREGVYQVVDVGLNIDGNLFWLALEQRAQFLSILDRTNGSADALIGKIEEMTRDLEGSRRQDGADGQADKEGKPAERG